jgi:hypothetical protein
MPSQPQSGRPNTRSRAILALRRTPAAEVPPLPQSLPLPPKCLDQKLGLVLPLAHACARGVRAFRRVPPRLLDGPSFARRGVRLLASEVWPELEAHASRPGSPRPRAQEVRLAAPHACCAEPFPAGANVLEMLPLEPPGLGRAASSSWRICARDSQCRPSRRGPYGCLVGRPGKLTGMGGSPCAKSHRSRGWPTAVRVRTSSRGGKAAVFPPKG